MLGFEFHKSLTPEDSWQKLAKQDTHHQARNLLAEHAKAKGMILMDVFRVTNDKLVIKGLIRTKALQLQMWLESDPSLGALFRPLGDDAQSYGIIWQKNTAPLALHTTFSSQPGYSGVVIREESAGLRIDKAHIEKLRADLGIQGSSWTATGLPAAIDDTQLIHFLGQMGWRDVEATSRRVIKGRAQWRLRARGPPPLAILTLHYQKESYSVGITKSATQSAVVASMRSRAPSRPPSSSAASPARVPSPSATSSRSRLASSPRTPSDGSHAAVAAGTRTGLPSGASLFGDGDVTMKSAAEDPMNRTPDLTKEHPAHAEAREESSEKKRKVAEANGMGDQWAWQGSSPNPVSGMAEQHVQQTTEPPLEPVASPQLARKLHSLGMTSASASLQRLTSVAADQFTVWNLKWRPPSSMSWAATLGDGSCFWHALLKSAGVPDTLPQVASIKIDILHPPPRLCQSWLRCFGGTRQGLQDDLSILNREHQWADWRAVGLSALKYDTPIAVWDTRAQQVTLHWSPNGDNLPQHAWLLRLHQDHFEPATRPIPFADLLCDQHGPPELAGRCPQLRGGALDSQPQPQAHVHDPLQPRFPEDHPADDLDLGALQDHQLWYYPRGPDELPVQRQLGILTVNVGSLRKHLHAVLEIKTAQVIIVTEARATESQHNDIATTARRYGWLISWGAPAPLTQGPRPCPAAVGVAILYRPPLTLLPFQLPECCQRHVQEGRLHGVKLSMPHGHTFVVLGVYADTAFRLFGRPH